MSLYERFYQTSSKNHLFLTDAGPQMQDQGKSYYMMLFFCCKKSFFKKSKEETSSSPMPDLTSKRVGVGELLAIAPSRRTSKFKTVSIANIYTNVQNHIGWLFLF